MAIFKTPNRKALRMQENLASVQREQHFWPALPPLPNSPHDAVAISPAKTTKHVSPISECPLGAKSFQLRAMVYLDGIWPCIYALVLVRHTAWALNLGSLKWWLPCFPDTEPSLSFGLTRAPHDPSPPQSWGHSGVHQGGLFPEFKEFRLLCNWAGPCRAFQGQTPSP